MPGAENKVHAYIKRLRYQVPAFGFGPKEWGIWMPPS